MTPDPVKIALADKSKPLTVRAPSSRPTTCKLSGCPIDEHTSGVVRITGIGTACAICASDHGWEVKWW